jgi:hypothetical protein
LKLLLGRWALKIKRTADGSLERYKARLVIKGYKQQLGVDFRETLASVCRYESIRLLLAIVSGKGLNLKQFDVFGMESWKKRSSWLSWEDWMMAIPSSSGC